ncbi:MAG: hypothetical protein DRH17_12220 [Deltaproteobacteria bacterium]|nr:MAG: hypothetical protein DRH17_12220 [Deltaproteobacteria bacterium]
MSLIEYIDPAYLKDKLASMDTQIGKMTFDGSSYLYVNAAVVANPSNLDVALSTRASESTLSSVNSGISGIKTQTDKLTFDGSSYLYVNAATVGNPPNLDVALSTRASESTLSGIKTQTDKLTFDGSSRLYINAAVVANPSNLDVALSTRLADNKIPNALGQLNKDVGGSTIYALATVPSGSPMDITRMPYTVSNVSVSTTESNTTIASPGAKLITIRNFGDNDVLLGINGSVPTTNPLKVKAHCCLSFIFGGATSIYYKTSSGTSTIDITYFN